MFCVLLYIYTKTLYATFCGLFFSFSILLSQVASGNVLHSTGSSAWNSGMTQTAGMGGWWEDSPGEGGKCTHIAESLCRTAETNATL